TNGGAMVPIPFVVRFGFGVVLAVIAGRLALRADPAHVRRNAGCAEALLIVALTVANPTLWVTALSLLVAIVPLSRTVLEGISKPVPSAEAAPASAPGPSAPQPADDPQVTGG